MSAPRGLLGIFACVECARCVLAVLSYVHSNYLSLAYNCSVYGFLQYNTAVLATGTGQSVPLPAPVPGPGSVPIEHEHHVTSYHICKRDQARPTPSAWVGRAASRTGRGVANPCIHEEYRL